jgi:[acyl-carrier-protein] S-malonyltransferase
MGKIAFIFPGQGSQFSGMGKDACENYASAREMFESIDKIARRSISQLCFEGSDEDLKQTINSQPAILAVSLALLEAVKAETGLKPDFVAGHSLGEYSALYAAGVIELDALVKLVSKRAELMNSAPAGSMSAVLGMDEAKINELVEKAGSEGIICAANYNTPDQTVISGEAKAVEAANEIAKQLGAKRVIPLAVSGAFHSPLMQPLSEEFAPYVNATAINDAQVPVVTNVDAKATIDKAELAPKMVKQMYSSVYWTQSVNAMVTAGVDTFVEIGPGKVLSGMIKKIAKEAKVYNACDAESIGKLKDVKELIASQVGV